MRRSRRPERSEGRILNIGPFLLGSRTLVIAELGINHQGSEPTAHRLIEAAKSAGADAVKVQMFRTNALVKRRGPQASFLAAYEFQAWQWKALKAHADDLGLTFLASVFDEESADAYFQLEPLAVKIGSGELHCLPLIEYVAGWRLPLILSTGMATLPEVKAALETVGQDQVALLHCVSAYPVPLEQVNLKAMDALGVFHVPVGYSDHTIGTAVSVAAVARGACIIEKHLTLDCGLPGPDHQASANPATFAAMVSGIRQMEKVLGDGDKRVMPCEVATRKYCRFNQSAATRRCRECKERLEEAHPNQVFCADCRATHKRAGEARRVR